MCTVSQVSRTMGLRPGADRIAEGGDQRHHEDQRKDEDAEALDACSAMHEQIDHGDQEGAHRQGLVEVGDGAAIVDDALFDDGDEVEDRAQGEGGQGDAEEVLAAADQGKNGMQQTERVQRGGHAQPDDAHFSHGRIAKLLSETLL